MLFQHINLLNGETETYFTIDGINDFMISNNIVYNSVLMTTD